ncbi:MAG: preprotein translocase subunit YajC [Pseudomonadales bacterium]|jgi:preprotein translocase subunit YajC|nr:preprotein translocase subunit YajC [Pseudomonadales bacterium]MCP5336988.1 preprotein translocase subunit YajC [Pseudomonadales bacterium]
MFLIPAAHAQGAPAAGGDPMISFAFMIGIFALFYFIAIRPQRKRQKEHQDMLGKLAVRDEVATTSGILGRVTALEQDFVVLKVADDVEIKLQKWAVQSVLPKGTLKGVGAAGEKK